MCTKATQWIGFLDTLSKNINSSFYIDIKVSRRWPIISILKVPKCENFHRTDFFDFYTMKPLWVGDFRAKIKN